MERNTGIGFGLKGGGKNKVKIKQCDVLFEGRIVVVVQIMRSGVSGGNVTPPDRRRRRAKFNDFGVHDVFGFGTN